MKSGLLFKALAVGVPVLLIAAVLGLVALSVVFGLLRSLWAIRRASRASPILAPAVQRWGAGAWCLWTGGEDCAGWPEDRARESLASWYGATDPGRLQGTIDGLVRGTTGNAAWDRVRAIDLLRIGVAAGYLTPDQCWDQVRRIANSLRAEYPSWEALAVAFETGMNDWHDSRGVTDPMARSRVQRNLGMLRTQVWPTIPYDAPL